MVTGKSSLKTQPANARHHKIHKRERKKRRTSSRKAVGRGLGSLSLSLEWFTAHRNESLTCGYTLRRKPPRRNPGQSLIILLVYKTKKEETVFRLDNFDIFFLYFANNNSNFKLNNLAKLRTHNQPGQKSLNTQNTDDFLFLYRNRNFL